MSTTEARLIKLIQKNEANIWSIKGKIQAEINAQDDVLLGDVLWRGCRQGCFDLAGLSTFWSELARISDALSGEDVFNFFDAVARRHVSDVFHERFSEFSQTPGWHSTFEPLLVRALEFDGVASVLAKQWHTLPEPYNEALGYRLAKYGALDVDALPEDLMTRYARVALYHELPQGQSETQVKESVIKHLKGLDYWDETPWPEPRWHAALAQAACSSDVTEIRGWHTIQSFARTQAPEQVFEACLKLCETMSDLTPHHVVYVATHAQDYIELFTHATSSLKLDELPIHVDHAHPNPLFFLSLGYLACCQSLGQAPDPSTHSLHAACVHGTSIPWYATLTYRVQERRTWLAQINGYLSALSSDILEPMLWSAQSFPLHLASAAPTQAVMDRVALYYNEPISKDDATAHELLLTDCLGLYGEPMIPSAIKALRDNTQPARVHLYTFIAMYPTRDDVIGALVGGLSDGAQKHRDIAQHALLDAPLDLLAPHLQVALNARAKSTRERIVRMMSSLPPSHTLHGMAQARHAVEKVKSIKELLTAIKPGADIQDDARSPHMIDEATLQAAADAIVDTRGSAWRKFESLGAHLITAFMRAWARSVGTKELSYNSVNGYEEFNTSWLDMLATQETGVNAGVHLLTVMDELRYGSYLTALDEMYDGERVGQALATLLAHTPFERPALFEPRKYPPAKKEAVTLLFKRYPTHAPLALHSLLTDKLKASRTQALAYIKAHPTSFQADDAVAWLDSKSKDSRDIAAQVLAEVGDATHLPALEVRQAKEKTKAVKAHIEAALTRIKART